MKFGILTQPLINNYGGILQNKKKKKTLKRLGVTSVTLNFAHRKLSLSKLHFIASFTKRCILKSLGHNFHFINPIKDDEFIFRTCPEQDRFITEYINKINLYEPLSNNSDVIKDFDGFIVGSDQVWRPLYSPNILNFYLNFASDSQIKISYSASFGTDIWEYSPEKTALIKNSAKRFNAISVREKSGITLCKKHLDVEATHVIDPTMLLSQHDYINLFSRKEIQRNYKNKIVCYILDQNKIKHKFINSYAHRIGAEVEFIGIRECGNYQSIEHWLKAIYEAKFVITDSFHGTVFSVLFNKEFITLGNPHRGNTRIISLLDRFCINGRMTDGVDINFIPHQIDWNLVNSEIKNFKDLSLAFLISNIHGEKSHI